MTKTSIGGRHIAKERGLLPTWSGWPFRREVRNTMVVLRNSRAPRATTPGVITAENLAARVCHVLGVPPRSDDGNVVEMLRTALVENPSAAIAAAKPACLEIAEDEAEQCHAVGATAAPQTALTIAARIRKRHVEVR